MNWNNFTQDNKICVIVPTYNNSGTLSDVLHRIMEITDSVIVVNDGSTDGTMQVLENEDFKTIEVVSYTNNRGKGYALKAGFRKALELGYENAVTIDSDGQHFPEDIPNLFSQVPGNQGSMIVGVRSFGDENMPGKNRFANRFSNFWFQLQTGVNLPDTQCGFRLYPLKKMRMWWPITSRYESELELMVFSSWRGIPIVPVKVNVYYPPENERVSHFKPGYDFFRISILNTILTFLSIIFVPVRIFRKIA